MLSRHDMVSAGAAGAAVSSVFVLLLVLSVSGVIGAVCWPYVINTWLEFFDKDVRIVWWHGALLGFCPAVGQASIPVAVITWLVMLFLVA